MSDTLHPCGYCGELTSNGCDVVAVVACDRHFGADTRAFAEMHEQLATERARAEAAEGREARLREALVKLNAAARQALVTAQAWDEQFIPLELLAACDRASDAVAALAGTPEGEP